VDDSPVLIRYDGSEGARSAIIPAAALLVGRAAVILNVGPLALVAEAYAALRSGAADLDRRVDAARAELDTPGWRGVVAVADEVGAAAIVLGSRGLTGVPQLVEGSLSHKVAEHARRPVLELPPNEPPLS
jgi:nucleotide-binding universal stress UspA family protein